MSININTNNLYLILPSNVSFKESNISDSMQGDFTLFARVKLDKEKITEKEAFIISRSGMHSGISVFKNEIGKVFLQYTYWFENPEDKTNSIKQIHIELQDSMFEDFIDVYMTNSDDKSKITCHLNDEIVGSMIYAGLDKVNYTDSPYWFGCGSMFTEEDARSIGDFEYHIVFSVSKKLTMLQIKDLVENYDKKYTKIIFETYKVFNSDLSFAKDFAFFCDFDVTNRYKVWNYAFNGNYPQIYIEGNVYY
jgi:hypothetical protein